MNKRNNDRIVGEYASGRSGPLLLMVCGIHGNEPASVAAAQRVFDSLHRQQPELSGRMVAFAGNLKALERNQRFINRDLNRMWSPEDLARLRSQDAAQDSVEESEQRALLACIESELQNNSDRVIFLDLHSTSASGPPFSLISDTLQNRQIALAFPLPVILGLEEAIDGSLLNYFGEQGFVSVGVEGGQHLDAHTADHHESIIWLALVAGGLLGEAQAPDLERHRQRLAAAAAGLPSAVEIVHRHGLAVENDFRMEDGFVNFAAVTKNQIMAHDRGEEVRSPVAGLLVLPRYQAIGDDGFFLGRKVSPFWLKLSVLLRKLRLDLLIPLLPGVRRHPTLVNALRVDKRVARWLVVQIFHLFGFRRCRPEGDTSCSVDATRVRGVSPVATPLLGRVFVSPL